MIYHFSDLLLIYDDTGNYSKGLFNLQEINCARTIHNSKNCNNGKWNLHLIWIQRLNYWKKKKLNENQEK